MFGRKKPAQAEISKPQVKITQKNNTYWQFSWITEVKNKGGEPLNIAAIKIKFVDSKGYVLHEELVDFSKSIAGHSKQEYKGIALIDKSLARNVKNTEVELQA